jgi:hypothetical protein
MATPDRSLIDATNQTFWDITNYKRGQRLDMNDPQDRAMAERWRQIYAQVSEYRTNAWNRANQVLEESMKPGMQVQPYVLVIIDDSPGATGQVIAQTFPRRANLDVQYQFDTDQVDKYTYAAAFDFTQKTDGPVADTFAIVRRKQQMPVSGWR